MSFPLPHILHPAGGVGHTHTLIFLPGRATTGPELFSDLSLLPEHFPTVRFVFPTATTQHSTVFQEDLTEWFDIYSLSDPDSRPELQLPGLRQAVGYIGRLIDAELELLGGNSRKLVLGGMSMGMATAIITLLSGRARLLGGFVGISGWCPFAADLEAGLATKDAAEVISILRQKLGMGEEELEGQNPAAVLGGIRGTPVFLGHGEDDAYVDIELGRRVTRILGQAGVKKMTFKTYRGAEEEGHWIKEPEELDDIVGFLEDVLQ